MGLCSLHPSLMKYGVETNPVATLDHPSAWVNHRIPRRKPNESCSLENLENLAIDPEITKSESHSPTRWATDLVMNGLK